MIISVWKMICGKGHTVHQAERVCNLSGPRQFWELYVCSKVYCLKSVLYIANSCIFMHWSTASLTTKWLFGARWNHNHQCLENTAIVELVRKPSLQLRRRSKMVAKSKCIVFLSFNYIVTWGHFANPSSEFKFESMIKWIKEEHQKKVIFNAESLGYKLPLNLQWTS